jgi:hypothetical protein
MRLQSKALALAMTVAATALMGCSNDAPVESGAANTSAPTFDSSYADYYQYLGNIDYSTDAAAFVWEQVEGEDPGIYGIQYREIIDFNGITSQQEIPVVLFFYSSSARGSQNLAAGVEDLAQCLVGRVLFIAVDGVEADAISTAYQVGGYPEFILLNDNARISTFSGFELGEWDIDDVSAWLTENGYEPDTSMLLR